VAGERLDPGPAQGSGRREHRLERQVEREVQPQGVRDEPPAQSPSMAWPGLPIQKNATCRSGRR
jgi:hypothetical protein